MGLHAELVHACLPASRGGPPEPRHYIGPEQGRLGLPLRCAGCVAVPRAGRETSLAACKLRHILCRTADISVPPCPSRWLPALKPVNPKPVNAVRSASYRICRSFPCNAHKSPAQGRLGRYSYRMVISYDGTEYCGWQLQPSAPTVQRCVEAALGTVLREERAVLGVRAAGRTDSGVHARGQVRHTKACCGWLVCVHRRPHTSVCNFVLNV